MKIVIKTTNVKLSPSLKRDIQEKINSLEKFAQDLFSGEYSNYFFSKGKPRVEAWFEVGKETLHHKKGPFFWAECQMRFPKKSIRATARAEDLKIAINGVKDELKRKFKEYKEKVATSAKRGARIAKKELKISPQARFYRKGRIREEGI